MFIMNIQYPETLDALRDYIETYGRGSYFEHVYLDTFTNDFDEFTVPKKAMIDDTCLFMCAKTSHAKMRHLKAVLRQERPDDMESLWHYIDLSEMVYEKIGGKVFAMAELTTNPYHLAGDLDGLPSWYKNAFARSGQVKLVKPIDVLSMTPQIKIARAGTFTILSAEAEQAVREQLMDCTYQTRVHGTSFPEQAIGFYLEKVVQRVLSRSLIAGKEVDIYLPDLKTAVEYNGEYWHRGKRRADFEKRKAVEAAGIRLITIDDGGSGNCVAGDEIHIVSQSADLEWAIRQVFEMLGLKCSPIDIQRDSKRIKARYQG